MNDTSPLPPRNPGIPDRPSWRDAVSATRRFWERQRLAYNLALTGLCLGWVVLTWPHFRPVFTRSLFLPAFAYMLFLAALGNICYCAAYPVDIALQWFATPEFLRRGRAILWWAGLLVALALAWYWIGDEIY